MFQKVLCAALCVLTASLSWGQTPTTQAPSKIIEGVFLGEVASLAEQIANGTAKYAEEGPSKEVNPRRAGSNAVVPGKGLPTGPDPLWVASKALGHSTPSNPQRDPILVFDVATPNATPTDPTGAVGPNHFVAAHNSAFRIFNKDGDALTGNMSLATIWPGESSGDPIVMYDAEADRWFISQFFFNGFLVAVSTGPDPENDGWYTYQYSTDSFPDYPKYSIWSDGYYVTANKNSGSAGTSDVVFAMDRTTMLTGGAAPNMIAYSLPGITTNGFFSPLGFSVSGPDLPPAGGMNIIYLQDDAWGGVSDDHLKIWTIETDWDTPANSSISLTQELMTSDFDSVMDGGGFSNIPQPAGADIDAIQATIMYMASYRRFGAHNSVLINFAVDLDGSDDYSGIRWYELRQYEDGGDWEIYQEGTYVQPDGHSCFVGTMCQDISGNIGMGYTVCSSTQAPSLRYTGRYASDPLGEMTVEEGVFADGGGNDPSTRYGDYSQLTLDPIDDKTFWYIGEHFGGNGNRTNTVGTFKLAPVHNIDVGVTDITAPFDGILGAAESVTITVRNHGILEQSNIPVYYQIDGGTVVNDVVPGPIASGADVQFTFGTPGDFGTVGQTYTITAGTEMADDADENNDDYSENVTNLHPDDVGVTAIVAPVSADDLGNETVTVTVENFGGAAQTGFNVSYTIDGGAPVVESFDATIEPQATETFNFATAGDFTGFGDYTIWSGTSLVGDSDLSNDDAQTDVTHNFCQPGGGCFFGDGFQTLILEDINNPSGCSEGGYSDFTNLSTGLNVGTAYEMTVVTGYGDQFVKVWIDFNDNSVFEADEVIINDYVIAEGEGAGEFTANIPFTIPETANLGEHLMRAKTNWQEAVPGACDEVQFGETEDYMVDLLPLGVEEGALGSSDLQIATLGGNQYFVTFHAANLNEVLTFQLFDASGRVVMENRLTPVDGVYQIEVNLSYAAAGSYLMRLGNAYTGKVARVVVR